MIAVSFILRHTYIAYLCIEMKIASHEKSQSISQIIEAICKARYNVIVSAMVNPESYLSKLGAQALSRLRIEFFKRDLLELQSSSLDLVHYAGLIREMQAVSELRCGSDNPLIISEIRSIANKYT